MVTSHDPRAREPGVYWPSWRAPPAAARPSRPRPAVGGTPATAGGHPPRHAWARDPGPHRQDGGPAPTPAIPAGTRSNIRSRTSLREWRSRGREVQYRRTPALAAVLRRSVEDLGALRMLRPGPSGPRCGRRPVRPGSWRCSDATRCSRRGCCFPWTSGLAIGTLHTLAAHQGATIDPATEEEPGRILHEMRFGPASLVARRREHLLRHGRRDAAVRHAPRRAAALGARHARSRRPAAARRPRPGVDRAIRRPPTATASSSTTGRPTEARQPGVERLLGRNHLRRRAHRARSHRPRGGAGLRLRRLRRPCPLRPRTR